MDVNKNDTADLQCPAAAEHVDAIFSHLSALRPVVTEAMRSLTDRELTPEKMLRSFLIAGAGKGFLGTYEHLSERYTLAWKLMRDWSSERTGKVKKSIRKETYDSVKKLFDSFEEDLRLLGVTVHSPKTGSDYDPNYHLASPVEKVQATETSIAGTIGKVDSPGFSWLDEVKQEVVIPAQVSLYDDQTEFNTPITSKER